MLEKVKTWFRRLGYYTKKDILTLNNILFAIAFILCLTWTYRSIESMSRNWFLEEKLKTRQLEQTKLQLEVDTLRLEQEYYKTNEYKELMARKKSGKMLPGESMVILPKNSDAAINKYNEEPIEIPSYRSNFSQWLDFLFS